MCEYLIDDEFSLLNANLPDAELDILASDAGFTLGNAQAIHRQVETALRTATITQIDGWEGREIVLPIKVLAPHSGGRSDMAARMHLALQHPRKLTRIPCDRWGAEGWWRIDYANVEYVTDDFNAVENNYQLYNITLGVDAWAKSTELFTATGTNAIAPTVVYDHAVTGATGWVAENGTLDAGSTYVGVNSDGSSVTRDTLKNASLAWDSTGYAQIRVECKANPASGLETGGGSSYPSVQVLGYHSGAWETVSASLEARTTLSGGWYAERLRLKEGLVPFDGIGIVATGGDPADQDLEVRLITLVAGSTFSNGAATLVIDVPGSAPTNGDLTVSDVGNGLLVYNAPNLPEIIDGTMPGRYHLLSYVGGDGWETVRNDIMLPGDEADVAGIPIAGVSPITGSQVLVWVGNRLTGYKASYTIVTEGTDTFQYVAPTPAWPIPRYLVDGVGDESRFRSHGRHDMEPGANRIYVAWASASAPDGVTVTWQGYPAFHTDVVPSSRWTQVSE